MAGSQRAGNSAFWTTITDLSLASVATAKDLYTDGINRVADRSVWLRDEIVRRTAALASTTAGTRATVTGSADLSTLTYDPIAGDLNGLTLQVQADTGGIKTVTFGSGAGVAPTGPADVVSQMVAQTSGQPFGNVDAAGHLSVGSTTTGSGSTIAITGGSATTLLGLVHGQNATGISSGADGISGVGGAAVTGSNFTVPAGTLRSMLQYVADNVPAIVSGLLSVSKLRVGTGSTPAVAGDACVGNDLTVDGGASIAEEVEAAGGVMVGTGLGAAARLYVSRGSYDMRDVHAISASATTATIDAGYPAHVADSWAGSGGVLACTLSTYGGSDKPEVYFKFVPADPSGVATMTRQGAGSAFLTYTGPCEMTFRWNGSKYLPHEWSGDIVGTFT
jgi:hypothetical protein